MMKHKTLKQPMVEFKRKLVMPTHVATEISLGRHKMPEYTVNKAMKGAHGYFIWSKFKKSPVVRVKFA